MLYGYNFAQILGGIGVVSFSFAAGLAVIAKIVSPLIGIKKNGKNSYVLVGECTARHEAEIQRHKEVKLELSKLFDKSDVTQSDVSEIKGILKGMAQVTK